MTYIDQSGNTFLIAKKPTEEELANGIYDNTLNNDTDLITAIFNGEEIPLWFQTTAEPQKSQVATHS